MTACRDPEVVELPAGIRAWRVDTLARAGALETTSAGCGFQVENTWRRAPAIARTTALQPVVVP